MHKFTSTYIVRSGSAVVNQVVTHTPDLYFSQEIVHVTMLLYHRNELYITYVPTCKLFCFHDTVHQLLFQLNNSCSLSLHVHTTLYTSHRIVGNVGGV